MSALSRSQKDQDDMTPVVSMLFYFICLFAAASSCGGRIKHTFSDHLTVTKKYVILRGC